MGSTMGNGIKKPILCIKSNNFIDKGTTYWCDSTWVTLEEKHYIFTEKNDKSPLFHCDSWFVRQHFTTDIVQIRDILIDLLIE